MLLIDWMLCAALAVAVAFWWATGVGVIRRAYRVEGPGA